MRRPVLVLSTLCSLALGCARGGAAARPAAPQWTADDSAALDRRIDELEERLLAHQARVAFWEEMRARHANVTAVACENLSEHATAMRANEGRHQVRLAERRRSRVAAASDAEPEAVQ